MGEMHICRTVYGDIFGPIPMDKSAYDQFRAAYNGRFTPFNAERYIKKEIPMLQPRGPRVLVKRIDAPKPQTTLIIPETVDGEKSCYALVLAIGNKITEDIKVADTVILTSYCGSPVQVELDGETLDALIVMQDDVLAVVVD
jgi:co-chaperonin GroES (HSP10)